MDRQHLFPDDITGEQAVKVFRFRDFTDMPFGTCQDVLQRHNWDVGFAIEDYMNLKEGRPTVFALTSEPSSAPAVAIDPDLVPINADHFEPSETGNSLSSGTGNFLFSGTGNFLSNATHYVWKTLYDTFVSVVRYTLSLVRPRPPRPPVSTDPVADVERFIRNYESVHGIEHPVFYRGSFAQALIDAQRELRFLVVYLHRTGQSDCSNFCSAVLQDEEVISCLDDDETIFWACEQGTTEGNRVAVELKVNNYPYVAVIVLKDGAMTLVGQIDKPVSSYDFVMGMNIVFDRNEDYLTTALEERVEQSGREDRAYLESLRAVEHEEQLKREKEKENQEREHRLEKEMLENIEKAKIEDLEKKKIEMLARIPQEPTIEDPGAFTIVFIMPGGIRIERRFADISPLSDVFDFVFCHPNSPDTFEVATNFPKRVLNDEDRDKTLCQAGLQNREVLFINNLDL